MEFSKAMFALLRSGNLKNMFCDISFLKLHPALRKSQSKGSGDIPAIVWVCSTAEGEKSAEDPNPFFALNQCVLHTVTTKKDFVTRTILFILALRTLSQDVGGAKASSTSSIN